MFIFMFVKQMFSKLLVIVISQKAFHTHQLLRMIQAMMIQAGLIMAIMQTNFTRVMILSYMFLKV